MSNVLKKEKLLQIRNQFLCCIPVNDIGLKDLLLTISWEEQHYLINQTIKSELIRKYPLRTSYQKAFLKNIITILEENSVEVHDDVFNAFCNILSCEDTKKYYYKHYIIEDKVITLKENKNFISEGTTGLCSWQASLALSQWCINNKKFLNNKTILELGSGVGLVGLTIGTHCTAKELILSDCHLKVLSVLAENVSPNINNNLNIFVRGKKDIENCVSDKLNSSDKRITSYFGAKKTSGSGIGTSGCEKSSYDSSDIINDSNFGNIPEIDCSVSDDSVIFSIIKQDLKISVVKLPWEEVAQNKFCAQVSPDLILAADVVYDNSVFDSLCGAIRYFLDRNTEADVILACTQRNQDTLREFLDLLEANNCVIKSLATPEPKDFFWSVAVPIRLFLVRNK